MSKNTSARQKKNLFLFPSKWAISTINHLYIFDQFYFRMHFTNQWNIFGAKCVFLTLSSNSVKKDKQKTINLNWPFLFHWILISISITNSSSLFAHFTHFDRKKIYIFLFDRTKQNISHWKRDLHWFLHIVRLTFSAWVMKMIFRVSFTDTRLCISRTYWIH